MHSPISSMTLSATATAPQQDTQPGAYDAPEKDGAFQLLMSQQAAMTENGQMEGEQASALLQQILSQLSDVEAGEFDEASLAEVNQRLNQLLSSDIPPESKELLQQLSQALKENQSMLPDGKLPDLLKEMSHHLIREETDDIKETNAEDITHWINHLVESQPAATTTAVAAPTIAITTTAAEPALASTAEITAADTMDSTVASEIITAHGTTEVSAKVMTTTVADTTVSAAKPEAQVAYSDPISTAEIKATITPADATATETTKPLQTVGFKQQAIAPQGSQPNEVVTQQNTSSLSNETPIPGTSTQPTNTPINISPQPDIDNTRNNRRITQDLRLHLKDSLKPLQPHEMVDSITEEFIANSPLQRDALINSSGSSFTETPVVSANTQSLVTTNVTSHSPLRNTPVAEPQYSQTLFMAKDEDEWGSALSQRMTTLVNDKVKEAKIRLDPPELGQLGIKITIEGDHLKVRMTAAIPQVQEMLENQSERFRAAFEDSQFSRVDVDIHHRQQEQEQQPEQRQPFFAGSDEGAPSDPNETQALENQWQRPAPVINQSKLDVFA